MSLSTRELYLALRVRDEGTRNLQRFAAELTRTGTAARVASLRAQADAIREQASLKRNEAALQRETVARLRANDASQAQIRGAQARASQLTRESIELEKQAKDLDRHAAAVQRNTDRLNHFTGTLTQTGIALQTLGVGLGFVGMAGFAAMDQLVDVAVEYQRQVAHTATQIDDFGGDFGQLADIGRNVAKEFAVPFERLQPALFDIFSSMEVTIDGAEHLLEQFAKAAIAGQVDIQSAGRATIGIMNAFAIPVEEVNRVLDLQFQLVQEGIGSYEEWAGRIGSVTPSAVRANQSLEMMLAALAFTTRIGIPAAQSATAVARAFDAMSNPRAIEDIEALGVEMRNADGTLRPFNESMRDLREVLLQLPAEERVGAILDIFRGAGSTIQARKFIQSILLGTDSLELFDLMLSEMTGDTGAFENAYSTMADTVAMRSQIIQNKWMLVKEAIGATLLPAFEQFLGFLERFLDWFDKLPASTKRTIGQFLLWGSVLTVVFGVLLVGLGLLAVFISSLMATWSIMAPLVITVGLLVAGLVVLTGTLATLWQKSDNFRQIVKDIWEVLKELGRIASDTFKGVRDAFEEHMLPPLKELWRVINETVLPAVRDFLKTVWEEVKPKLEEAGRKIIEISKIAFRVMGWILVNWVIPALQVLAQWWNDNKEEIKPLLPLLSQLAKQFLIIAAIVVAVLAVALVAVLGSAIGAAVSMFMSLYVQIMTVKATIEATWRGLKWLWDKITEFFTDAEDSVEEAGKTLQTFATVTLPRLFANVGTWLIDAGRALIDGFITGAKQKFATAVNEIKQFGASIINGLKQVLRTGSPSKATMDIGGDSALGYVIGFRRTLASAMKGTDAFLGLGVPEFVPNAQRPVEGSGGQGSALMPMRGPEKHITNHITIHTQELDVREQAARLGWELAGRM